jgi:hypothetical protein
MTRYLATTLVTLSIGALPAAAQVPTIGVGRDLRTTRLASWKDVKPQTPQPPPAPTMVADDDDWNVGIYPVYVWLPFGIGIDVTVPPGDGGDGGRGDIVDGRFDGAYFGGFYASKARFRVDADGLWAGFGGDRPDSPFLRVDADALYFHATGGVRLASDLYAVAGVRRVALQYDISIANTTGFRREPGVWDPIVGLAWHTEGGRVLEFHATFEGGGFGVGADSDIGASARLDIKPWSHFGITAGYCLLYLKLDDTVANRTFTLKQTLHGPIFGIGIYF